jgi:hypothetical protein
VTYWFAVGQLSCAVVSDGQMEPPLAPPLETFFTPGTGVPDRDLREALAAEGQGRTMMKCGYNCLLVETPDGRAVIDTGLGARFGGYGPRIEPLVGRLGRQLAEAEATELSAVLFTHLHQVGRAHLPPGDRVRARRGGGVLVRSAIRDGGRPGITTRSDRSSAAAVSWAGPPTRTSSSTRTTCRFPDWAASSGTAAPSGGAQPARAAPAEPG